MPQTKSKKKPANETLKGWKAIAGFLVIPTGTAQRWAREGMPVHREGRFTVADPKELTLWLGREAHMPGPAQIMKGQSDVSVTLKASIDAVRRGPKDQGRIRKF